MMLIIKKNLCFFNPKRPLRAHGREMTLIIKKTDVFSIPKRPLWAHGRETTLIIKKIVVFGEPHFLKKWTPRESSRRIDRCVLHEIAVRIFKKKKRRFSNPKKPLRAHGREMTLIIRFRA